MKISVIIPTYKPQDYLWECLDSLVTQTFPKEDFEVILVLNGCTEPYKSAIEKYVAEKMQGMNVNFIHTKTGGVSNARNLALDQVKGEFVTFIDDDDFVSPKYLELLFDKVDAETISLCYPYAFNDGNINIQVSYASTCVYDEMHSKRNLSITSKIRRFFNGPCLKLIPMDTIKDRRFDVRFKNGEDSLFMFLISDNFNKYAFTSKNAVYYRRYRKNSAVTRKRNRKEVLANGVKLIGAYSTYFLKRPLKYNWIFFSSRIFASIRDSICG